MKKIGLLLICLAGYSALFAQNEKKDGDDMAAAGNFSGAAIFYRLCMENDEQCVLKLFKLIYDEKIEAESPDELFQLINPLAQKGRAEGQYYLGELYRKGIGGVSQDFGEAIKWMSKSADQGFKDAQSALDALYGKIGQTADSLVDAEKYNAAADMYRLCMVSNEEDLLKFFNLICEKNVIPQPDDDLLPLILPLAQRGNQEAQYYLGILYRRGIDGVRQDDNEASRWLRQSADRGFAKADRELRAMTPKTETVTPQARPQTTPQTTPQTRPQTATTSTRTVTEKKAAINKDEYKPAKKSKLPGTLFVLGSLSIVAGAAATYLLPPTVSENWDNANEANPYYEEVTKRDPTFLIAGCAVGGICIGTGIIVKKKKNSPPSGLAFEYGSSLPQPNRDNYMRINWIATGNGAGLRLTF